MKTFRLNLYLFFLFFSIIAPGCIVSQTDEAQINIRQENQNIVGGTEVDSGYNSVVLIITRQTQGRYSFCTGALISATWILTAAHCIAEKNTSDIQIFLGKDYSSAKLSDMLPVARLFPHESYKPPTPTSNSQNDIALIKLQHPVSGIIPARYNKSPLPLSPLLSITWVGYGMNNPPSPRGAGVKRRGTGRIDEIYLSQYLYKFNGEMPCRGDSGGPSFASLQGSQHIIGIVSAGDNECRSFGVDTRVDAYQWWISDTMSGTPSSSCPITGGSCPGGVCYPISEENEFNCLPSHDLPVGAPCDTDHTTWTSAFPCSDGSICISIGINSSDDATIGQCMAFCMSNEDCQNGNTCQIPIFSDIDNIGICISPPQSCNIIGGDCPEGESCFPFANSEGECHASDGIGLHEECDSTLENRGTLPCADGLLCVEFNSNRSSCMQYCYSDSDCAILEECHIPIFTNIEDLGVCIPCTDRDSDGACSSVDCNDFDDAIYPGAPEGCDDEVDNDCDGTIDRQDSDCYVPPPVIPFESPDFDHSGCSLTEGKRAPSRFTNIFFSLFSF